MKLQKLKINSVPGYTGTITIKTDSNGVPLDKFWRNRIKESELDNCVEIVKPSAPKKKGDEAK